MKKLLFISLFVLPFILNAQVFNASSMRIPASGPTITLNPIFVNNFSNVTGTASAAQSVTVAWANLTTNVSVNALSNFEYSYDGTTYASSLSIPKGPGSGDTLVYIRGTAAATTGTHTGNVQFSSTGATTIFLAVTCVVSSSGTATITRSPTSYSGGTTTVGTPGPWQTATINGSNLTAGIAATSPAGWELSFDNGVTNVSTGTIPQSGGTITNFILQFRLTGASVGSPSGNIALSSTGATTVNIAVSGTVSSATAVDTLMARFALNRTTLTTPDYVNASGNPALGATANDGRNYQSVTITSIPSAWIQVNAHASSSTGGISNSTVVPANVGLGYWFTGDGVASAWPRTTVADTSIQVSGLDPTKVYTFNFYVANSVVGSCGTPQYVCIGVVDSTNNRLDTSAYINSRLNTSVISPYKNKRPNAAGIIWITVHAPAGGTIGTCQQYGLLNSIEIWKQVGYE